MVAKRQRNYRREYEQYHGTEKEKARRAARGRHRYAMEKKGRLKPGMEVEHKNGNALDGSSSNLTVRSKQYQRRQGGKKSKRGPAK